MTLICKKCGKEYDDSELKCPYCGEVYTEDKPIEDILEVKEESSSLQESPQPLTEVKLSETPSVVNVETPTSESTLVTEEGLDKQIDNNPVVEKNDSQTEVSSQPITETSNVEIAAPTELPEISLTEVAPVIDSLPVVEEETIVKADMSIIETPPLDSILPTDTLSNLDETNVSNDNLETISVEAKEETLEVKEEVFEIPEMPAPEVGEVDFNQLINKYDNDEKINLEKMEAKKQYDAAVSEQKRLEEEAKKQQPMPKPDLLATIPDESSTDIDIDIEPTKKKGKKPMRKVMNAILIILGVAIVGVLVWYGIQNIKPKENNNYMQPIDTYFTALKAGNSDNMLKAFVPCVAQTDELTTLITTTVSNNTQYGTITLEYKESNTEVVNTDDQKHLDDYLKTMCPTSTPKIDEYKHVYVEQKIKGQEDKEFTVNNPQFWVVKIENNWYILQIQ